MIRRPRVDCRRPDKEGVLRDLVRASAYVNDGRETLFLSGPSLVTVDDNVITPLSIGAFQGWCVNKMQIAYGDAGQEDNDSAGTDGSGLVPKELARVLLDTPSLWRGTVPVLKGLSPLPVMRPDGSLLDRPGFDSATGVFCTDPSVGETVSRVPKTPSRDDAMRAAQLLIGEVYADFPFEAEADAANAFAMLVAPLTRHVHRRPLPLFGIAAPERGTGKGLLVDITARLLAGRDQIELRALPGQDDELRKAITGLLRAGNRPVVVWDNIAVGSPVSSNVLAALHTADTWSDRLLGTSSTVSLANDRLWIATGNQLRPGEDMIRRFIRIGLDARQPHPEERHDFRHPRLKEWVDENRVDLMVAVLTMLRAWHVAGRPPAAAGTPIMGDYSPMIDVVGGILTYAGVTGFLLNTELVRDEALVASDDEEAGDFFQWLMRALTHTGHNPSAFTTEHVISAFSMMFGSTALLRGTRAPIPGAIVEAGKGGVGRALSSTISRYIVNHIGKFYGPHLVTVRRLPDPIHRRRAWSLSSATEVPQAPTDTLEMPVGKRF